MVSRRKELTGYNVLVFQVFVLKLEVPAKPACGQTGTAANINVILKLRDMAGNGLALQCVSQFLDFGVES
jgi:hypothetical protein